MVNSVPISDLGMIRVGLENSISQAATNRPILLVMGNFGMSNQLYGSATVQISEH
jgi:hypothetical protein